MPPKPHPVVEDYKRQLATFITDSDIARYFPDAHQNIVLFSHLKDYPTMHDLLPHDKAYKFILIETKKNSGHWTCVCRYGDTFESLDSYGCKLQNELKFIPQAIRQRLGETTDYMSKLVKTIGNDFDYVYNKDRLQANKDAVSTCGRWCILRILMMKEMNYDLQQFLDFIHEQSHATGKPLDVLVCDYVK